MKAYLKFTFYNPHSKSWEYLRNGMEVQVCHSNNEDVNYEVLAQTGNCNDDGLFAFDDISLPGEKNIFFRVGFLKRNLDLRDGQLYAPEKEHEIPVEFARYPVPLITWSSFHRKAIHGEAGFFHGIREQSLGSPQAPLTFAILFRKLFVFGHRGAPFQFPENSVDAFSGALEIGTNAIEFDLCLTADKTVVVLHDPDPTISSARQALENLPYPLVSPQIELDDDRFRWRYLENYSGGVFSDWQEMQSPDPLKAIYLKTTSLLRYYAYQHPVKKYVQPPLFSEVFQSLKAFRERGLAFFLDIKIDRDGFQRNPDYLGAFAAGLYRVLKTLQATRWHFIIGCPNAEAIKSIAKYFAERGNLANCDFTIDSEGGIKEALTLGLDRTFGQRANPLQENLQAGFRVVSIGKLARPGSREEIREVVTYREAHTEGPIDWVIYWTIDDEQEIYELVQEGVDGILTNHPERAVEVCRRLKIRLAY